MEGNIGKNSRTGRPDAAIKFDHLKKINGLRGQKVDRILLMSRVRGVLSGRGFALAGRLHR
jgi:hypothetical protein